MERGFIFDLDGVITDTAEYHYLAWKRLADEEGLPFTREDNEQLRGVSREESLKLILKGKEIAPDVAEAWATRKNDYYRKFLQQVNPTDLLAGVYEFLIQSRAQGIRLGLASASKNAKDVIEKLSIVNLFSVLGDGYAVVNTKPAVDLFAWVAGGLQLPTTQCVVFEDAEAGVNAALAVGMKCVGIGPKARVGAAQLVCQGLHEITVEQVLAL